MPNEITLLKPSLTLNERPKDEVTQQLEALTKLVIEVRATQQTIRRDGEKSRDNMIKSGVPRDLAAELSTDVTIKCLAHVDRILHPDRLPILEQVIEQTPHPRQLS